MSLPAAVMESRTRDLPVEELSLGGRHSGQLCLESGHPDVAATGVVGCPDEPHGEVREALVVSARQIGEAVLAAWLAERVAPYKRPRRVVTVDQLPRTPASKVLRRKLR